MENKEQPLVELKAMDKGPLLVKGTVKLITPDGKEMVMERTNRFVTDRIWNCNETDSEVGVNPFTSTSSYVWT